MGSPNTSTSTLKAFEDTTVFLVCTSMLLLFTLSSCTPRVEVAPSDKPITINLNVKIDHEVRVRVEKDVEKLVENDELF